jgi:predicted transcriptional regulator
VKKFEFRKRWRSGPCTAYIYRSGSRRELSAYMKLGTPIYGAPQEIGRLAEQMLPGNGPAVEEYLMSTQGGYAIPIEEFREFPPFSLAELRMMGFHPPQYFFYLSNYPELQRALEARRNG